MQVKTYCNTILPVLNLFLYQMLREYAEMVHTESNMGYFT